MPLLAVARLGRRRQDQLVKSQIEPALELEAGLFDGARVHEAELLMERRGDRISQLTGQNPVVWLAEPPGNYLGAFGADEMREKSPGNWYFDTSKGQLVYIPRRAVFGSGGEARP